MKRFQAKTQENWSNIQNIINKRSKIKEMSSNWNQVHLTQNIM